MVATVVIYIEKTAKCIVVVKGEPYPGAQHVQYYHQNASTKRFSLGC